MRVVAFVLLTAALAAPAAAAPVADVFRDYGLFGTWAAVCGEPASPANPHVAVETIDAGTVVESQDLGAGYAINRYTVVSAEALSATRLRVEVMFQPEGGAEERQELVFRVRDGTRRTLYNRVARGAVRVRGGIALAAHTRTPLLHKCG